jgi:transketolase
LVATGSEVPLALDTKAALASNNIKATVVSMPCQETFLRLSGEEQDAVLPPQVPTVSIEAACSMGWHRFVGRNGLTISIDTFGASGPGKELFQHFGFSADSIVERVKKHLG